MTLVYLAVAWCAGIWLAHQLWGLAVIGCGTSGWLFAAPALAAAAIAALLRQRAQVRWAAVLLILLLLGGWRYQQHPFAACASATTLASYNGSAETPVRASVEGVIAGYPDVRDTRTFYRLRADTLTIGARTIPVQGDVLVQAPRFPAYAFGDRIRASGQLETPPTFDDFDYAAYLSMRGVHSLLRRARTELIAQDQSRSFWTILYGLRARGAELLNRALPEPAAALANGMLLGIESGIPDDVGEAFQATGTSHVIVISGSNIALLTGVLMGLLARVLGKARAPYPVAVAVIFYVLLVGADPPALRAGIMGVLYVIAIALGRASTAYVSLCASALIMCLLNPLALWDIGFQLSFSATLGLILFTPPIQARFERFFARHLSEDRSRQVMGVLNDALIVTLAAQVPTLPLLVYYFGRLSLVSLVANFLILPAQPPIMIGGMAALVVGLIWEVLGRVAAVIPWFFLTYTTAVVSALAAVPLASVETGAVGRLLAVLYGVGLAIAMAFRRFPRLRALLPPHAGRWLAAAAGSAWLMLMAINQIPDGQLHVTFIPGEDGEVVLITTPGGRRAWVWDGRGDGAALATATRAELSAGRPEMSLAVGPDAGDLWPGARALEPEHTPPGTVVRLDGTVELIRLAAGDGWLLRYGRFRTLVPATIRPEAQAELLRAPLEDPPITLLKAPGAGTGVWPTEEFLAARSPQVILWPDDTTYPPNVAAWLSQRRATRIPGAGVVEVTSDGDRMWLAQRSGMVKR